MPNIPPLRGNDRSQNTEPNSSNYNNDAAHGTEPNRSTSPVRNQAPLSPQSRGRAARDRALAQMASQQQASATSLREIPSSNLTDIASAQSNQIVGLGSVANVSLANNNLRSLSTRLSKKSDCDDLLEALETKHENGSINIQTYRMYADALSSMRNNLPNVSSNRSNAYTMAVDSPRGDLFDLNRAHIAITRGVSADEAINANGLTRPQDVDAIRRAAATIVANGGPRADFLVLNRAHVAINRGASADEAINANGLTHPQDIDAIRRAARRQ